MEKTAGERGTFPPSEPSLQSMPSNVGESNDLPERLFTYIKMEKTAGESDSFPSSEPSLKSMPSNVGESNDLPERSIIKRPGFGSSGKRLSLLTNHFKVSIKDPEKAFYQYHVSIVSESDQLVDNKVLCRKVMDKLYQTYSTELDGKMFAYDGEKCLYTVGPFPRNKFEFTVVLDESFARRSWSPSGDHNPRETSKRSKGSLQSKTFIVEISYAAKIPLKFISLALQGADSKNVQDALRVLDIVLLQQAAKRGCLLVRQSFFHDDSRMFTDVGGGVTSVRGLHSSFRPTLSGLSLNIDVSTTIIFRPGSVLDFLLSHQNVKEPHLIDWAKAKNILKNLRVKARHNNMEFKIIGLSEKLCSQQLFSLKLKSSTSVIDDETLEEITVYDYFVKRRNIELKISANMPCLDVGKSKRPSYLPIERYTKALSTLQRASLVEKSRQKPPERIRFVTDAERQYRYDEDPILLSCGISIEKQLTQLDGRVLVTPKLKVGNGEDCIPHNGRWNFNGKTLLKSCSIERWALVNFSARCDASHISRELIDCGRRKGIQIERPHTIIEEDPQCRNATPVIRVERMFEQIFARLPGPPKFLLCVLPERKNSLIYGPWKKKCLTELGFVSQCIAPLKVNDQYLTNVLLKINSKLGGINSLLEIEHLRRIPVITDKPTMIIGLDVSHGSPGQSDVPSIAAVVGSREWPLISRYRAAVRTQPSKEEIVQSLFKPLADGTDDGIMRELLFDFYITSNGRKPTQIIVFRDGVSETQFAQVVNIEINDMIKAYKHLGGSDIPKFTVIVVQKNHHTRFFQPSAVENVPPGTVVDTQVVHPRNYDFYMCSHAGMLGTSRPAHYHVLLDEIGFSPDVLQNLIHSLSYAYQRSTRAISVVAPVAYAHLAAQQVGQFVKFDDLYEISSGDQSIASSGSIPVPQLPRLHKDVAGSMFFC